MVERNVGIFSLVARNPFERPMTLPVIIPKNIAGQPKNGMLSAAMVPENVSVAPTETSMLPIKMIMDIPIAAITRIDICRSKLMILEPERKVGYCT